ncbi:MAG: threonine--tRNA ligase, partial [Dehalococcoidia bacterium]
MAEAILLQFPEARFGIGPATSEGFYYDFDLPRSLTPEDLAAIESKMREIIASNSPFLREEVDKEKAHEIFGSQPFKLELIDELPDEIVTVYRQGSFVDLCRGPHVTSTGEVKAFKLLSIAGAYWRGDEHRPMLQRIYGTAFETEEELESHLKKLDEAAKRDHRKLGKVLDLFSIHEEAGAGLVYWHPKGAMIRNIIEDFWKSAHFKRGYDIVNIPHLAKIDLWKRSGHLEFYRDAMYPPIDIEGQGYLVKPMNCPGHILIYKTQLRSYRQLPLRWAELGTVYRWERSGVLHGLTRVRGFTQDDAHIFCRPDQLEDEVVGVVEFACFMLKTFGFDDYEVMLSTRPEKYAGTIEVWEQATETLKRALER